MGKTGLRLRETETDMGRKTQTGYSNTYSKSFYHAKENKRVNRPLTSSVDFADRRKSKRYRGKKGKPDAIIFLVPNCFKGVSIGKSLRPLQRQAKSTPGPGSYNLREKFASGRAVAWKPRKAYLKIEDLIATPGPAAYKIKSTVPQM